MAKIADVKMNMEFPHNLMCATRLNDLTEEEFINLTIAFSISGKGSKCIW